jgi:hypothetical protein
MSVDFCYIISHGFAARMLLQTNLIGRLTEKGYTVALISPDVEDENLIALVNNPNIELIKWNTKSTIWDDNYLHKRMYFLEDIDKNSALKEKFYNSLFYSKSKHPWKRVRPLFYYLIYLLAKIFPSIKKNFLKKEGKHLASEEAQLIIEKINPKLLISTYPVSIIEAKMLYAAKNNNIVTMLQLLSWDNITSKGHFPVLADHFIVWGDIMYEELQEYYGIADKNITICGIPHFDEHIKVREKPFNTSIIGDLGLSSDKPYLFVAMSSPRFAPKEIDIVEWLSKSVFNDVFGTEMQLIVRPHPQNMQEFTSNKTWINRLKKLTNDRVAVDYPVLSESNIKWSMKKNDMVRLAELISGCSICINSGSTVSIDALFHNKPAILTSFDGNDKIPYWNSARRLIDYTHQKKLILEGGVKTTDSYESLEKTINLYLNDLDYNIDERRNALYRECYLDDGQSTERVISVLSQTLKELA